MGITRFKYHLSRLQGGGVASCTICPDDVSLSVRVQIKASGEQETPTTNPNPNPNAKKHKVHEPSSSFMPFVASSSSLSVQAQMKASDEQETPTTDPNPNPNAKKHKVLEPSSSFMPFLASSSSLSVRAQRKASGVQEIPTTNHNPNPNAKKHKVLEPSSFMPFVASSSRVLPSPTPLMPMDPSSSKELSDHEAAERSIAMFFIQNQLDFGLARSSSYKELIDAVKKCGSNFFGPSTESLRSVWVPKIKTELILASKEVQKEWPVTGCTLVAEAWMSDNQRQALINFLVASPSGSYFHKSVDVSSTFESIGGLCGVFDTAIQEVGQENVVHVVMDAALFQCTALVNHIIQKYNSIFVSPCAWQSLNIILEEFSRIAWVNKCIVEAQSVSKFIYKSQTLPNLMKGFTSGQDIVKTGITKAISDFLSLECMLKQRPGLKQMFNSPEYAAISTNNVDKAQGLTCIRILNDNDLWRIVDECVSLSEPFLKVMRQLSGGSQGLGFIHELITRAKLSIGKNKTFLDIFDKKWHNHSLHSAAAFLNPRMQYNVEATKFVSSTKEGFFGVLEKFLPTPELRRDISNEMLLFTRASGIFGCNLAKEAILTVPPAIWWEQYGDASPTLQRVAIRILSQVCCTFEHAGNWSTFKTLQFEKDNFGDLAYVHYNLKLQNLKQGRGQSSEVDALQLDDIDMSSEWVHGP